ncbi:MAG TPA: serine hydrolase [Abditibacteriaceae bacterium]|jgi:CubicO group peptidase (beta-lactamase class C family)
MSLTPKPLLRSTPEAQGIPSCALIAFINAAQSRAMELHSLMLLRHGHVVAHGWWSPYAAQHPHMLYSLSKSFAATAAGLAIAEGHFSLDDPVLSFFPDDAPQSVDENLAKLCVRHLLSMSTGHDEDTTRFLRDDTDGNWVRAFLARPVEHEPGTHFVYNSGATYMVSAIVQKVTGTPILNFLQPRLFEPLGIIGATWESCPREINMGGWGLSLKTEDIARFGQLYLQKGMWDGVRLLPESWVDEATTRQVSNGTHAESDWEQGYGYQFWCCRHNAYRGDGAFGQFCIVMPEQDLVLAITSNVGDMQALLNLVWEHLLPSLSPTALTEDHSAQEQLRHKSAHLAIATPQGQHTSSTASQVSGRTYNFAENGLGLTAISFEFGREEPILTVHDTHGTHHLICGYGEWQHGKTKFLLRRVWPVIVPQEQWKVATNGAWTATDTFVVKLCFYETPFSPTLTCRFVDNNRLLVDVCGSVGFGPAEWPQLEGFSAV